MRRGIYGAPPSGDPFTDRRRTGIGGSDTGAILGISPFSSALACWEQKRGVGVEVIPSERMVWGNRLQDAILQGYAEDTGRKVRKGTFRRHQEHPFVIGHPDALSDDRLIEVKTSAYLGDQWGPDGSEQIPPHYYTQVQHYLVLTGLPAADLIVLVGGREMHTYPIQANPPFQSALLEEEAAFWHKVVDGEPPEPDGSESAGQTLRRMFPRSLPEEVVATPEVQGYAADYRAARNIEKAAGQKAEHMKQLMQRFMGSRERLLGPDFIATWSDVKGSTSWKEVAGAFRDLLVPHYDDDALDAIQEARRGETSRRFELRERNGG